MSSERIVEKAHSITEKEYQKYIRFENDSEAEEAILSEEERGLLNRIQRRRKINV